MTDQTDAITAAIERVRELERSASEAHALYMSYQDEVQRLGGRVRNLTAQLSELRRAPGATAETGRKLEGDLRARREELNKAQARQQELAEQMHANRALAQRCREWLESGGASFESLATGVPQTPVDRPTVTVS